MLTVGCQGWTDRNGNFFLFRQPMIGDGPLENMVGRF